MPPKGVKNDLFSAKMPPLGVINEFKIGLFKLIWVDKYPERTPYMIKRQGGYPCF
jgi:hypothetical protein